MKIGILTQPLHNNYGGLLQAYALQTILKRLGHDSLILDRHKQRPSFLRQMARILKYRLKSHVLDDEMDEGCPFWPTKKQKVKIGENTAAFVREYIKKTEVLLSTKALSTEVKKNNLQGFIVGSDQVWRPRYSPCVTSYFFDFLEGSAGVKRIAYAASFGVDGWEIKPNKTQACARLAQAFDAISVREDSGVRLCKEYLGVDAEHVLDPTLLLDPVDYERLVKEKSEPVSAGNLMTYVLDPSDDKNCIIQKVATLLNLTPFTVMPAKTLKWGNGHAIENCVFPRVTQWLRGFMDAEFLIADSFHGCVFALLFNVPFFAIGNRNRGLARFHSLLKQFSLTDRLLFTADDLTDELITGSIDWARVNKTRERLKKDSLLYLTKSISRK